MLKYWWNKKLQKPCNNVFIIISQGQVANCDLWIIRSPLGMFLISPSGFPQPCPSRSSKSVCQWRRREPVSWSAVVDIWSSCESAAPAGDEGRGGGCYPVQQQMNEQVSARDGGSACWTALSPTACSPSPLRKERCRCSIRMAAASN